LTKTAYASFVFDADKFFEKFSFSIRKNDPAARKISSDRFSCQIYLKVRSLPWSCSIVLTLSRPSFPCSRAEQVISRIRILQLNAVMWSYVILQMKQSADLL